MKQSNLKQARFLELRKPNWHAPKLSWFIIGCQILPGQVDWCYPGRTSHRQERLR